MSQNVLRMPRLSDSMSEATIVGWLKQPGEAFLRGEPLVEVETDKATVVHEAEADGLLAEILVHEGGVAALGEPITRLGGGDGDDASHEKVESATGARRLSLPGAGRADPARTTSSFRIRPVGPVPSSSESKMPSCTAVRRATGVALARAGPAGCAGASTEEAATGCIPRSTAPSSTGAASAMVA